MESTTKAVRTAVYQRVFDQIIRAIERGEENYRMPWHNLPTAAKPVNAVSRKPRAHG